MLGKLALRNAKRSFKDYLVYMITVTFAFALIFSFNAAVFSKDILELSDMMESFQISIVVVSVIVVFVIGWLINYTMRFMLEKRSKEFGTYSVLGIDNKKISNLFFIENILLGLFSLLLSFIVGTFLYQIIIAIIMNLFDMPYQLSFDISGKAFLLTILYFTLIFAFSLFKNRRKLRNMKTYDLLYFDKKNENAALKKKNIKTIICIFSLICGGVSVALLSNAFKVGTNPNMLYILLALILIIICLYGFYLSASTLITSFALNKKRKYKGQNLFLVRNFTSKINTMGITLGTLALLFCLTFISMNVGMFMKGLFDEQIMRMAPYDISVYNPKTEDDFKTIIREVEKDYTIEDTLIYKAYSSNSSVLTNKLKESNLGYQRNDSFLRLSDYNKLRDMLNLEAVKLGNDKYLIHVMANNEKSINEIKDTSIVLQGKKLTNQEVLTKGFSTEWIPGCTFVIVVNDEYVDGLEVTNSIMDINTLEETKESYYDKISGYVEPNAMKAEDGVSYIISNINVKGKTVAENKSVLITFAFSLFYLAFILTATAGTILSIRQLSDSNKYKFRYQILDKLGMPRDKINGLIFKQLLIFFLFPILLPLILSMTASIACYQIFVTVIENSNLMWQCMGITTGLFLFIYLIYFVATYVTFKKNINS